MRVWMVHRESGRYSDWTYDVRGVFSTYDKACEYINSLGVLVGRMECDDYWEGVDTYGMDPSYYDYCDMAIPVSIDGVTFKYVVAGSDIPCDDVEPFTHNISYHITEYELDKVGVANGNEKASLRPCPFCGGEAVVMHMDYGEGCLPEVQTVWGVWCRSDMDDEYGHGHCIENYATEQEAIAAWNGMWECSKEKAHG